MSRAVADGGPYFNIKSKVPAMTDMVWVLASNKEAGDWLLARVEAVEVKGRVFSSKESLLSELDPSAPVPLLVYFDSNDQDAWQEFSLAVSQKWGIGAHLILTSPDATKEALMQALEAGYRGFIPFEEGAKGAFEERLRRHLGAAEQSLKRHEALAEIKGVTQGFISSMARISRQESDESQESKDKQGESLKVLVVDSDTTGQGEPVFRMLAEHQGLSATKVEKSAEALELVQKDPFDIFIVDNELSDGNALELMKELSEKCPGSETIYVVGFTAADSAVEALRWGAASFLIKPFPGEDLMARVDEIMKRVTSRKRMRHELQSFKRKMEALWVRV